MICCQGAVAQELVHHTTHVENRLAGGPQPAIEHLNDLFRLQLFGQRGEAADIDYKHAQVLAYSPQLQRVGIGEDFLDDVFGEVAPEQGAEAGSLLLLAGES